MFCGLSLIKFSYIIVYVFKQVASKAVQGVQRLRWRARNLYVREC